MSPTPEELELGAKAAKQVRFYEKFGARNLRQTPWCLAGCAVLLILLELFRKPSSRHGILIFFIFFSAAILMSWLQNRVAKERYANQKMILRLLEEKYGDALPWVVEEKQLARARELEAAIAQGRPPASHA
jgi:hypothetical protein